MARRRAEWFEGKSCVDCGGVADLRLDHVDASLKVSHRIWSWARERREAELAKCVVRCEPCHLVKTWQSGENTPYVESQVRAARELRLEGLSYRAIAEQLSITRMTAWNWCNKRR